MNHNGPVFIVGTSQELGQIERMSGEALTTQGLDAAGIASLVMDLADKGRTALVCLNGDAAAEFSDACAQAGAPYRVVDLQGMTIDANDGAVVVLLTEEMERAQEQEAANLQEARRRVLKKLGVHGTFDVLTELAAGRADREPLPTGIANVDAMLGGGLPTGGVTIMGALSTTGKTTLSVQIGDNVAAAGRPVLFVSCEQSKYEIVAMSVSRLTRLVPARNGGHYVANRAAIQSKKAREGWGEPLRAAFDRACAEYAATISPRMYVMEPDGQPSVAGIRKAAEAVRKQAGDLALVIVDYLQLLAPENEHMDERRAVGANTQELRQLARDMGISVLLISALNRASYGEGVSMSSFRESSAIEYSSDLLLGLEPQGMNRRLLEAKPDKQRQEAREIVEAFRDKVNKPVELRVLKNRAGAVPRDGAALLFEAASSYFRPDESAPRDTGEAARKPRRIR